MNDKKELRTFSDFYPFYLGEHANRTCRRLHFAGTSNAVALLIAALVTQRWWFIPVARSSRVTLLPGPDTFSLNTTNRQRTNALGSA